MPKRLAWKIFTCNDETTWDDIHDEVNKWINQYPGYKILSVATERINEKWTLDKESGNIEYTYNEQLVVYYYSVE